MKNTYKASKRPWKATKLQSITIDGKKSFTYGIVDKNENMKIALLGRNSKFNSSLIVKAVNEYDETREELVTMTRKACNLKKSHDALLEACKVVMQEMLAYRRGQEPISCDAMDILTIAIEKAEGK